MLLRKLLRPADVSEKYYGNIIEYWGQMPRQNSRTQANTAGSACEGNLQRLHLPIDFDGGDLMARRALGGRATCESCPSIDVREWHRQGRLHSGQHFSWSWTRGSEPAGSITVRVECAAVVLAYRSCSLGSSEWKSVEQHVPIRLTACHLGGQRPWFVCSAYSNGHDCGRRAAILYCAGGLFACRRCYDLSYASQQQTPLHRRLERARAIRMRLGGSADLQEPFPSKPKGMHRRTFQRLRARAEAALFGRQDLSG
jgi:hypothetical protein